MLNIQTENYTRIPKNIARIRYRLGLGIYVTTNNMHPDSHFMPPVALTKHNTYCDDFDTAINEYEYYNCNARVGRYAAYYMPTDEYKMRIEF